MKTYTVNGMIFFKGDNQPESKYRIELSQLLKNKFGEGPYSDHDKVREVTLYSYNYFCEKFIEICSSEKSYHFYIYALSQHEQAIELALFGKPDMYPVGISEEYIALYRRILKWILEQACDIQLTTSYKLDRDLETRINTNLNELVFIGKMILTDATLLAEQDMIEDVGEVVFDKDDLYIFRHKHHYEFIIQKIKNDLGIQTFKHVVDDTAIEDLKAALKRCFNINYDSFSSVIAEIHRHNKDKGEQYCGFDWELLPFNLNHMFNANSEQARILYRGLTLDKSNKLTLQNSACKPQTMYRYLYRPILIWNVNGSDFAIIGKNGFTESVIQLATNAIPWGKAPEEWITNKCFKNYVHTKEDEHDKWLDDHVEQTLISESFHYHRNIEKIVSQNGYISLNQKDVGEIDFIIINHDTKIIYIVDCKHLQSRYDMMTQKNDYSNFVKPKGYNNQISNKVKWIRDNIINLDFHYKSIYGSSTASITNYDIQGMFIVNTPTFYMYNSDYRIYTVDMFVEAIRGTSVDFEATLYIEEEDWSKIINIRHPYFKKPDYLIYESTDLEDN